MFGNHSGSSMWFPVVVKLLQALLSTVCICFTDISLAVPITNSLTLLFTTVTSSVLGEKLHFRKFVCVFTD